ncbi:MAG: ChbG/HpnK family deacetylase [Gemmatimonadaceae bacterium]|nr:ChbG/HpnK family deacetylase [Gemmatimonadaceae bacterium]
MARTRLIVNADDFGISPAVTDGILEAHSAGTVTSTSMMVHCPGWAHASGLARTAPTLGIGLHFNILSGAPLVPAASLSGTHTGRFLPLTALVARALTGRLDGAEVEAECEAQLQAIERIGVRVTHIDSHRHTHALPAVRAAVARVASRRGLPLRRPVESHRLVPGGLRSHAHRAIVAWSWRAASFGAPRTRAPDHFIGISMQGGHGFHALISRVLSRLPSGSVELMVHPGHADAALSGMDGYTWQRERELAALLSAGVRSRMSADDVALAHFGQL